VLKMPVRPIIPTLKLSAIQVIGNNFSKICYGVEDPHQMNKLIESEEYLKTIGPFKTWPAQLLEELYEILCRKRCSSFYLNILIQPQIRTFKIQPGTIHYATVFLQRRCPKLESFELTGSIDVNPEFFIDVFSSFPNLVKLDLSGNVIDDRAFETIGIHCQSLQHLNVSSSTIQDGGLRYVSVSPQNVPHCKKLKYVNLLKTRLSKEAVGRLLYFHPLLTDVKYEDIIGAFSEVKRIAAENSNKTQFIVMGLSDVEYRVKVLSCHEKRDINEEFQNALEHNPEYEEIRIIESLLESKNLSSISCKNLQSLELRNNDDFAIDFEDGIAPILSQCGRSLRKLSLEKFCFVDVELIGKTCKKLEILSLSHVIKYGKIKNLNRGSFCFLEELDFLNEYGCHIAHNILKQLLFNGNCLQYLHLQGMDCLDDILWTQVISKNNLTSLVSLTLDQCHSISGEYIAEMIDQTNSLQILNIWSCKLITSLHKEIMKKTINRENYDMYFRCLPYMGYVARPLPPVGLRNNGHNELEVIETEE